MLESGLPTIVKAAERKTVVHDQGDQLTMLIAFGPAEDYMLHAGIKGEPEEEIDMSTQKDRYMKKYGGGKIQTALDKPIKKAAEILGVSVQTISNIRAAFNHQGNSSNGKHDESDKDFNLEPPDGKEEYQK